MTGIHQRHIKDRNDQDITFDVTSPALSKQKITDKNYGKWGKNVIVINI
ncbi:hypothetical protein [Photorhabdus luminescens]|nr:hypothetical protein [Photorhabdus luminescens]